MVPDRSVKQAFLVVYDYGSGGVWAYVRADSAEEIEHEFPELKVVFELPTWMSEDERRTIAEQATHDLRDDRTCGLLAEILDRRSSE